MNAEMLRKEFGARSLKIWPVVENESADEVGEDYNPFMGSGSRDDLPLVGQPVCDVAGQIAGAAQSFDVLLHNGGGHPLASRSRHGWGRLRRDVRTWALELECAGMDKQRRKKA